jgi:RecB family exonuclease
MPNVVVCSPIAGLRLERAEAWLAARAREARVTVVGASVEAANDITRQVIAKGGGAAFGWHRTTLGKLAASLSVIGLAEQGLVPVGVLPLTALCARVVEDLAQKKELGRFQAVADRPGLPRALARTIQEVRLAGVAPALLALQNEDLARVEQAYEDELRRAGLADRALVLKAAARVARNTEASHPLLEAPLLLLDVQMGGVLERELIAAVAARSPDVLATVPAGDDRTLLQIRKALRVEPEFVPAASAPPARRPVAAAATAATAVTAAATSTATVAAAAAGTATAAATAAGTATATAAAAAAGKAATKAAVAAAGTGSGATSPSAKAKAAAPSAQASLSFAATGPLWSRPIAAPAAAIAAHAPAIAAEASSSPAADAPPMSSLRRLQVHLFSDTTAPKGELGADVVLLSAPGESRECVEIARRLQTEAERGVPFEKMAVLLRAPNQYRTHIQEALRRAGIPAHFAQGTVRPDPSGRAFLALLACAADKLSARRFSEYLSLGEVPDATSAGTPPLPAPSAERWVPPDEEMLPEAVALAAQDDEIEAAPDVEVMPLPPDPEAVPVAGGTLRAPRHWEHLLVEAAVIGGRDRWDRRLKGLEKELGLDLAAIAHADPDDPAVLRIKRSLASLANLRTFALPLLDTLAALPASAPWGAWIDALSALATRALRSPERVLSVLAELMPMAEVGPVDLREVRLVLSRRLTDLVMLPSERKYGRVFVAPIEAARGLAFDVVFVPGLAEKIFPQKLTEDPILRDADRKRIGGELETNDDRVAAERLALRLAVGAARARAVLSYPRVDMDQSKPRVPSFYGLEVLRAAEGTLPGFDELQRRAEQVGEARIGWPAPASPLLAIDEAEHDLALLEPLFHAPEDQTIGTARYLLGANPHLARALRFRARRWIPGWTSADGLCKPAPEAQKVLAGHAFSARSYSPTALQTFAACPYKFFLHAIHKLSPRVAPDAIEEMNPLQRGSLVHEAQFEALALLRDLGLLPVTPDNLEKARSHIDKILSGVAERFKDELAPAIERVWEDTIASVRADLREWLRRSAELADERAWTPWRFELSFGLTDRRARDPGSQDEPAALDCGLKLRGSIDLVERSASGALRATDYKTGKVRATRDSIVSGGETLQPVLYALALEKLFPDARVDSGRLYYCTTAGGFESVPIKLDERARQSAAEVAAIIGEAVETAFLPAAPGKGACEYCDYQTVCGPYEELRSSRKRPAELVKLGKLRSLP